MSSLFSSQIHYLFREFTLNSLFSAKPLWIHYLFRYFTLNSLSYSLNHYEFTSCFAKSIQIHYLFRKFTLNPFSRQITMNELSASRFTMNILYFSRIHYLLRDFSLNLLSFSLTYLESYSLNHYECTSFFAILLEIHHLFANSLSVSRSCYEYTIIFANSLSLSRIQLECTIFFEITMNSIWNHYETTIK